MKKLATLLAIFLVLASLMPVASGQAATQDYDLPNGHFYTQGNATTNGSDGFGIVDDAVAPFWTSYQQMGGPDVLGYPISRRFVWYGLVSQATQRALLQWDASTGQMILANIVDIMHQEGYDEFLRLRYQVPPLIPDSGDDGLSWDQVMARHLALLDLDPAVRDAYFADPDPFTHFGLPMVAQDMGSAFVVRAQRAVIKHWKTGDASPQAGQIAVLSLANLVKGTDLISAAALQPERVSFDATEVSLPDSVSPEFRNVILRTMPAVVKVTTIGASDRFRSGGQLSSGSAVIFDSAGYAITNNHVVNVDGLERLSIRVADGQFLNGRVVAADTSTDLAVIKIDGADFAAATFGHSAAVQVGQQVAAIGYSPYVPGDPSVHVGSVTGVGREIYEPNGVLLKQLVQTDAGLFPGYSGGPLINESGEIIGINTAVTTRRGQLDPTHGLSISADAARSAVQEMMSQAGVAYSSTGQ
ncbi:MAG: trypsin-like serine protease [Chloroflexota bacterium]|nr:MAG: trypsin-like serine protease [Chloroflexota bacterium]